MEFLTQLLARLSDFANVGLITIGSTPITPARLVGLAVILVAAWWISVVVERAMHRVARRGQIHTLSDSALYALTRITRYVIWILGTIVGLQQLGFDLASLAIIGGAVGVGIGLGLQNVFANFISGIIILLEKTLKVGDYVDLQSGVTGRVTEISMRYTRVTTNDRVDVIVPNSEFVNGRVVNWTLEEMSRRIHVPFGVAYGSDKAAVREAGISAALQVQGTVNEEGRRPDVWLVSFGDSSLNFELVVWVGPELATAPGSTNAKYLWAIEDELRARRIEIPFPQRDLHLRSGALTIRMDRESGTAYA